MRRKNCLTCRRQYRVSNNISNVLLKVQATDRAKLMLMALEAGMGQADRSS